MLSVARSVDDHDAVSSFATGTRHRRRLVRIG